MKKILTTSLLGAALVGTAFGLTAISNEQDVSLLDASTGTELVFTNGSEEAGTATVYDEYKEDHAYIIFMDVELNTGYEIETNDNLVDIESHLYQGKTNEGTLVASSTSTLTHPTFTNGWHGGDIPYGDFENEDYSPYDDAGSNLQAGTEYFWEYNLIIDGETYSIGKEFTTEAENNIGEGAAINVSPSENSATINYDFWGTNFDGDATVTLTGEGVPGGSQVSNKLRDTFVVEGLESKTTYSGWKMEVDYDFYQGTTHTDTYYVPEFTTTGHNLTTDDISNSVDELSLIANENASDATLMDYTYSADLNSDLSKYVETVIITVDGATRASNVITVEGNKLIKGDDIELGTASLSKDVTNLTTSIEVVPTEGTAFEGSETGGAIDLGDNSPLSSFTQEEALEGITQTNNNPESDDSGSLMMIIIIVVVVLLVLIVIGAVLGIVLSKKKKA